MITSFTYNADLTFSCYLADKCLYLENWRKPRLLLLKKATARTVNLSQTGYFKFIFHPHGAN